MSTAARTSRSRLFDIAVAVAFAILAQVEVWGSLGDLARPRADEADRWLSSVLMLGVLGLLLRRTRTLTAVALVVSAILADTLWVSHTTGFFGGFLPICVLAYSVSAYLSARPLWAGLAVLVAALVLVHAALPVLRNPHDLLLNSLSFLGAVAVGRLVSRQRRHNHELTARTEELERQRETHAQAVLLVERARIAREIHDVIAHTISLMGVQAAAAEHVLDRSPERAREPLRAIQQQAREAIEELRRLLGVLRDDADGLELAPQPDLSSLDTLVAQMRAAGLPITVEVIDEAGVAHRSGLGPGLELSAYRIVQEALTNALKHAGPVPTTVRLHYGPEALDIQVTNHDTSSGRAAGQGHGIIGMRERVALHDGTFSSGHTGGDYLVHASLPLGQEP